MQPDTDGGVLNEEYVDLSTYENTVGAWIKKEDEKDIKDYQQMIHDFQKLYRKHMFDDDQTICKGYHEMIVNLKAEIKRLNGHK
jgi:hypothetical protein